MKINENVLVVKYQKVEWWLKENDTWFKALDDEQIQCLKDLQHLSKVKSIDVEELIQNRITWFKSVAMPWLPEVKETKEEIQEVIDENPDANYLKPNHLVRYLKDNKMKITKLELKTLECILGQGSFYEECWGNTDETWNGNSFIGWEIYESEVKGCRGALSSLKKKGIIEIGSDDVNGKQMQCYWTNYMLDFKDEKEFGYHVLDIPTQYIK